MAALMHGAQFAKSYVNDFLETDLPVRLVEYRNGWGADSASLPDPLKFLTFEPVAIDAWPMIITVAISTANMERLGWSSDTPSEPEYRVNYTMRTYIWAKANGSEAATYMRDRLTTVTRAALLDRPCLKATDARDTWKVEIDEASMREEFSDLTLVKGDRVMAGSYIGYTLGINEVVARTNLGTVKEEGVQIGVKNVGVSDTSLDLPTNLGYTTTGGSSE
jgi:hypothetical protein